MRIRVRHPRWGRELHERIFPAEAGLDASAVSFDKGCYIGQEIVARIHSRGAVNRTLVRLQCETAVEPGDEVQANARRIGEVTSASALGPPQALAYLKNDYAEPGSQVQIGSSRATVV